MTIAKTCSINELPVSLFTPLGSFEKKEMDQNLNAIMYDFFFSPLGLEQMNRTTVQNPKTLKLQLQSLTFSQTQTMKAVPGYPLPGPVVWSWGPACLYGCQIQPVCARISTRPTGCGSFRSSIGHEGLSTRRLGTPIERIFFLSLVYHCSLHVT